MIEKYTIDIPIGYWVLWVWGASFDDTSESPGQISGAELLSVAVVHVGLPSSPIDTWDFVQDELSHAAPLLASGSLFFCKWVLNLGFKPKGIPELTCSRSPQCPGEKEAAFEAAQQDPPLNPLPRSPLPTRLPHPPPIKI